MNKEIKLTEIGEQLLKKCVEIQLKAKPIIEDNWQFRMLENCSTKSMKA